MRADIVDGNLPPGHRLIASELSKQYGVSATPLREALQRLAGGGWVTLDPRLGGTVARTSVSELRDIYWLRDHLESLALELSVAHGDELWEQRVRDSWSDFKRALSGDEASPMGGVSDWLTAHRRFHSSTLAATGSPWLTRFVSDLADHSERYRMLSVRTHSRASLDEHQRLFEMAINRDIRGAVDANRAHLRRTVELLEPLFASVDGASSE